jgi:ATP-binding cassette subfamily C (CFTR/MRP) protein 1
VSTFAIAGLSDLEHDRVLRPSLVIQNYLFFTCLVDLVRVRTQWLLNDNTTVASLVTVTFILKLILLGLESREKWPFSDRAGTSIPALDRCGIFGRTLMLWLNPLFMLGYSRDLTMDDLYPLEDDLDGAELTDRLAERWRTSNQQPSSKLDWTNY